MLLEVSSVEFAYSRRTPILRDVSFSVERGERVGLIGPNGSGKSTLIRLLADLLQLRRGEVLISGRPHHDRTSRQSVAYVASNDYLPQFLSGREYVDLMHRLYGLETDADRVDDLFERYGIGARQFDLIEDYSHGMRKKVQVVSSLLLERPLTIIDETLNGVDVESLDEFARDAHRMSAHSAVIFCSHDFRLVEAICDRIIVLCRGELRHDLPLETVRAGFGSVDALLKYTIADSAPRALP